ncbi:MAG: polyphosphate polymerase domain-containing protein [Lewinellaceae bacterium]|nr:polyphosphate polymerase domain-containing protein [Lewinellaceae bacterium]
MRFEYKYIVPNTKLAKLREMIAPFVQLDKYAQQKGGEYTVRSIYFDTPELECYREKIAGVKRRNKVRLRGYNGGGSGDTVFFEIKKKVEEPLFKNRVSMTFAEALKTLEGREATDVLASENARRFLYHLYARRMQPVVTVIYEREPFQALLKDRDNDLRITFDKNLRAVPFPTVENLYQEESARLVDGANFIMEVKFNQYLPTWVKTVIASFGLSKGPASKYAMCVETLGLTNVRPYHNNPIQ